MSGDKLRVSRAALHFWEEPCISGTAGSGTVFFSGCNLRCVYCQNCDISSGGIGREMNDDAVIRAFDRLVEQGAHNINLVTPTHFVHRLASLLEKYNSPVPVVYNCGGYESVETLRSLDGLVDIYLPDFKYADNTLASAFSNAPDYFERACEAIAEMNRQVGTLTLDDNGVAVRGLIVRHLVLPGAVSNTKSVLRWIKENLPEGTAVSLMSQYTPCGKAVDMPPLDRKISKYEYDIAVSEMLKLGFDNGYIQSRRSARKDFIPDFGALEGLD
ncbi:MAG: radical SAM protein [Acutalibacteraceae bacterium]